MEAKILIIGILFLIYSKAVKKQKKKKLLDKRKNTAVFYCLFWAVIAVIISYMAMLNIPTEDGSLAEEPLKSALICFAAAVCGAIYGFLRVKKSDKKPEKFIKTALEWADAIYPVAFISAFVMYVFVQQFKIPSPSMKMTFVEGDRLLVNKLIYGVKIPFTNKKVLKQREVRRGDIIIFRFPAKSRKEEYCGGSQYGRDFIKRAVGLPGDTVEIRGKEVYVNGKLTDEPYARWTDDYRIKLPISIGTDEFQQIWQTRRAAKVLNGYVRDSLGPVKVPENSFFVLGDNRDHSCDSRFWGTVPADNVKGRAWVIVWPPKRITNVHNNSNYKKSAK